MVSSGERCVLNGEWACTHYSGVQRCGYAVVDGMPHAHGYRSWHAMLPPLSLHSEGWLSVGPMCECGIAYPYSLAHPCRSPTRPLSQPGSASHLASLLVAVLIADCASIFAARPGGGAQELLPSCLLGTSAAGAALPRWGERGSSGSMAGRLRGMLGMPEHNGAEDRLPDEKG